MTPIFYTWIDPSELANVCRMAQRLGYVPTHATELVGFDNQISNRDAWYQVVDAMGAGDRACARRDVTPEIALAAGVIVLLPEPTPEAASYIDEDTAADFIRSSLA